MFPLLPVIAASLFLGSLGEGLEGCRWPWQQTAIPLPGHDHAIFDRFPNRQIG